MAPLLLSPPSKYTPRFDYSYLVAVNIITCGIELCTSAAFCYLPPMLLEAGYTESLMSTIMALGPLCALFLLPVMGTLSDQCQSRYGRRKPFILALCAGIAVSLVILPFSTNIGSFIDGVFSTKASGILVLAFSVVLLDFCTQVAYTPVESLLSDPCDNEEQHNRSFSVFTFMLSVGACLGYWVSAVDWSNTQLGLAIGGQEHTLFAILLITFLSTAIVSLSIINDPQMKPESELEEVTVPLINGSVASQQDMKHKRHIAGSDINKPNNNSIISSTSNPSISLQAGNGIIVPVASIPFIRRPFVTMLFCPCLLIASKIPQGIRAPVLDTVEAMKTMPAALRHLWVANFFASTAVMGFRLYFTDYVGAALYHGNPESEPESGSRLLYEQGKLHMSFNLLRSICYLFNSISDWLIT